MNLTSVFIHLEADDRVRCVSGQHVEPYVQLHIGDLLFIGRAELAPMTDQLDLLEAKFVEVVDVIRRERIAYLARTGATTPTADGYWESAPVGEMGALDAGLTTSTAKDAAA